jgi:RNA polymerase sigma factor (sigma-70 family)
MNTVIRHLRRTVLVRDGAGLTDGQLLTCFVERRDEAAFEALVRRHGPMVLGVCRRLLHNFHDAEDAFQATFLVLARKASSVRPREMVANWLHGVAHRTSLKARTATVRRRVRERQVMKMPEPEAVTRDLWDDLQPLLDQELSRLPDIYRLPILLCDLEGKAIKEASRQLGWPQGTLAGRLARGRKLLARRLTQRGGVLSGGALALVISERAPACVPASLAVSTVKAAVAIASGQATATGVVSTKVAFLMEGVLKAMMLSKLKTVTAGLVALAMIASGGGLITEQIAAGQHIKVNEKGETPVNLMDALPTETSKHALLEFVPGIQGHGYDKADQHSEQPSHRKASLPPDGRVYCYVLIRVDRQDLVYQLSIPSDGRVTVMDAIARTNQPREKVDQMNVWMVRLGPNGESQKHLKIDWLGISQRGETKTNYALQAGDRLFLQENDSPEEPGATEVQSGAYEPSPETNGVALESGGRNPLPTSAMPQQALVSLERGLLTVRTSYATYEPYQRTVHEVIRHYDTGMVKIYDMSGKSVNKKQLPELLKKERVALVSSDAHASDPLNLRLFKEGTLLFVLPSTVGSPNGQYYSTPRPVTSYPAQPAYPPPPTLVPPGQGAYPPPPTSLPSEPVAPPAPSTPLPSGQGEKH